MARERSARMPTVVLYEPQNPINVGAAIRACLNCDVQRLRLVNPRVWDEVEMLRAAPHGASFVERGVERCASWESAVDGIDHAYGFTARGRTERQPRFRLDELLERHGSDLSRTAFVFGREDFGLPNEIVGRCSGYVTLETSPNYASLNLAQAVMIAVHRCFTELGEPVPMTESSRTFPPAPLDALERLMQQAEVSLDRIGFFRGDQRENVLRTIRRVLLNAEMDTQELATMWGVFSRIVVRTASDERRRGRPSATVRSFVCGARRGGSEFVAIDVAKLDRSDVVTAGVGRVAVLALSVFASLHACREDAEVDADAFLRAVVSLAVEAGAVAVGHRGVANERLSRRAVGVGGAGVPDLRRARRPTEQSRACEEDVEED